MTTLFSRVPLAADGAASSIANLGKDSIPIHNGLWVWGGSENLRLYTPDAARKRGIFNPRHPAHAQPSAAKRALAQFRSEGIPGSFRIAFETGRKAIPNPQRRNNDVGGVGGDTP